MSEVVNVVVALAVIVFIVRWATSSKDTSTERTINSALGFRAKNVTQEMVDNVHGAFPHIPPDNIRYDLLRTGSTEVTSHNILEKGFLEAPPAAYYRVFPRGDSLNTQSTTQPAGTSGSDSPVASSSKSKQTPPSLISRFSLEKRLETEDASPSVADEPEALAGGNIKGTWEESKEKREANLRERKAQMILAARKRMLAQQEKEKESAVASGSSIGVSTVVS